MGRQPSVVIIELDSPYTFLVQRKLYDIGVRSRIVDPQCAQKWLKANSVKAIILSGGASSVHQTDAPQPPPEVLSLNLPVLGICYGMHWIVHRLGGKVASDSLRREYKRSSINVWDMPEPLFAGTPQFQSVWMPHGDSVTELPPGFSCLAYSNTRSFAAMQNGSIWGIQFHPEVSETQYGETILRNFLQLTG